MRVSREHRSGVGVRVGEGESGLERMRAREGEWVTVSEGEHE